MVPLDDELAFDLYEHLLITCGAVPQRACTFKKKQAEENPRV
jgi:hypothetical protein